MTNNTSRYDYDAIEFKESQIYRQPDTILFHTPFSIFRGIE